MVYDLRYLQPITYLSLVQTRSQGSLVLGPTIPFLVHYAKNEVAANICG